MKKDCHECIFSHLYILQSIWRLMPHYYKIVFIHSLFIYFICLNPKFMSVCAHGKPTIVKQILVHYKIGFMWHKKISFINSAQL